jgi:hypothetical protein
MTKQVINIGTAGNDATGDAIRDAFRKANENFNELYSTVGTGDGIPFTALSDYDPNREQALVANNIFIVDDAGEYILSKELVAGNGISIDNSDPTKITFVNDGANLVKDPNPTLGGNLKGQGLYWIGGIRDPDHVDFGDSLATSLNTTTSTFAITKGYVENHYVNLAGSEMTGPLKVPADATGEYVPQRQEVVGKSGDTMTGPLLLNADPIPSSDPLTAATKSYVDNNSSYSQVNFFVSNSPKGRSAFTMGLAGITDAQKGRAWAYAFDTINEACQWAEDAINSSMLELGPYSQPITINDGATLSVVFSSTSVDVPTNTYRLLITNGTGTGVDQGKTANSVDLTTGKLVVGNTSGARGIISSWRGTNGNYDELDLIIDDSTVFINGETLNFDNATPKVQITVNVESGIYEEHLPIRVSKNVSIIGDELRRTIVRPKNAVSTSPWNKVYFYRDKTIDGLTINTTTAGYGYHYLTDPTDRASTAKNNTALDVFLMNDATGLKDMTIQGHGGFAVVLDPEGQILTKSPYIQNCSSMAASVNAKSFRGGMFIDGYAGRMPATITDISLYPQVTITGFTMLKTRPTNVAGVSQSETKRRPIVPTAFYLNGARYRIEKVVSFNNTSGEARVILGDAYTQSTSTAITLETAGNKSSLATHFTQVNDMSYGILATNNSLVELVSVFTYYNHTAYFALNGSQIRSISGSNAHGVIGLKAEGSDPTEVPRASLLADPLTQTARIYKKGTYASASYNSVGTSIAIVRGFSYIPYSTSEIQVYHTTGNTIGSSLYPVTGVTQIAYSISAVQIARGGNNGIWPANTATITIYTGTVVPGFVATDQIKIAGLSSLNVGGNSATFTGVTGVSQAFTISLAASTPAYNLAGGINLVVGQAVSGTGIGVGAKVTIVSGTTITLSVKNSATVVIGSTITFGSSLVDGTYTVASVGTDNITFNMPYTTPATITTTSITGVSLTLTTPLAQLSLSTGLDNNPKTFLADLAHNDYVVIRSKQKNKFYGPLATLSTRPSTSLDFVTDGAITQYRTIKIDASGYDNTKNPGDTGYGQVVSLNELPAIGDTRIITTDTSFGYIVPKVSTLINTLTSTTTTTIVVSSLTSAERTRIIGMEFGWVDQNNGTQKGGKYTVTVVTPGSPSDTLTISPALPAYTYIPQDTILYFGLKSFGVSTLSLTISSVATMTVASPGEILLVSVSTFINNGSYTRYVRIDDEYFSYTGINTGTNKLTGVVRAQLGSVAAAHTSGITRFVREVSSLLTSNISTCRVTSHDFLNIGTGSFNETNFPNNIFGAPINSKVDSSSYIQVDGLPDTPAEVAENNKGRVFFTSSNQDGFFRIGRFFAVDQSTGEITFSTGINLTNISGLQFKRGVLVQEFSNLDSMPALGDAVSTNTAVRGYIDRRLGIDENSSAPSGSLLGPGFMPRNGTLAATANMNLGSFKINNLGAPDSDNDAARKSYVDLFLKRSGGSRTVAAFEMLNDSTLNSGTIDMNDNRIINLAPPVDAEDAVRKSYVDSKAYISSLSDVKLTTPVNQNIFAYNGSKWINAAVSGDVTLTLSGNTLTAAIGAGKVTSSMIAPTVTFDQTKLTIDNAQATVLEAINISSVSGSGTTITFTFPTITVAPFVAGQRIVVSGVTVGGSTSNGYNGTFTVATCNTTTITMSGTASSAASSIATGVFGYIRALKGLSTFDGTQFTSNNGYIQAKDNGLTLAKLTQIGNGTFLGNNSGVTANVSALSFSAAVEGAITSPTNGILTRTGTATFTTTGFGTANVANSIVQRDASGNFTAGIITAGAITTAGWITAGNLRISSIFSTTPAGVDAGEVFTWANSTINSNFTFSGGDNRVLSIGLNSNNHAYIRNYKGIDINSCDLYTLNILPLANATYNLGGSGLNWNLIYGTATQARYADLAENYESDQTYETGTVVMLGGEKEVTLAKGQGTTKVAGVISEHPAHLMNSELAAEFVATVALQGRVPCKVIGKVEKGDMLVVSMIPGVAMASEDPRVGSVIGKALASYDGDRIGVIEVLVGKH